MSTRMLLHHEEQQHQQHHVFEPTLSHSTSNKKQQQHKKKQKQKQKQQQQQPPLLLPPPHRSALALESFADIFTRSRKGTLNHFSAKDLQNVIKLHGFSAPSCQTKETACEIIKAIHLFQPFFSSLDCPVTGISLDREEVTDDLMALFPYEGTVDNLQTLHFPNSGEHNKTTIGSAHHSNADKVTNSDGEITLHLPALNSEASFKVVNPVPDMEKGASPTGLHDNEKSSTARTETFPARRDFNSGAKIDSLTIEASSARNMDFRKQRPSTSTGDKGGDYVRAEISPLSRVADQTCSQLPIVLVDADASSSHILNLWRKRHDKSRFGLVEFSEAAAKGDINSGAKLDLLRTEASSPRNMDLWKQPQSTSTEYKDGGCRRPEISSLSLAPNQTSSQVPTVLIDADASGSHISDLWRKGHAKSRLELEESPDAATKRMKQTLNRNEDGSGADMVGAIVIGSPIYDKAFLRSNDSTLVAEYQIPGCLREEDASAAKVSLH